MDRIFSGNSRLFKITGSSFFSELVQKTVWSKAKAEMILKLEHES
jgi:hypothetical protein